jgi:hypothetical protein
MATDAHGSGGHAALGGRPLEQSEAHRLLVEARDMAASAIEAARARDAQGAADLIGRSSDRIGRAIFHMRHLLRQ